jgi:hypothetical protein
MLLKIPEWTTLKHLSTHNPFFLFLKVAKCLIQSGNRLNVKQSKNLKEDSVILGIQI